MRIIEYISSKGEKLYDFYTLESILKVNKSKLQRDINNISERDYVKYKNQYLYKENTLFLLIEKHLIERLDKMKLKENGL